MISWPRWWSASAPMSSRRVHRGIGQEADSGRRARCPQICRARVLGALIVALLTDSEGNVEIGIPEVAAFVAGGFVAHRTRATSGLLAGMAVYWAMRALI